MHPVHMLDTAQGVDSATPTKATCRIGPKLLPFFNGVLDRGGCGRWPIPKQQSSMLSPWGRGWAQGRAPGMARAQGAAQATRQGAQAAEGVEVEAPLLRATALTRTSKLVWTTSESPEQD